MFRESKGQFLAVCCRAVPLLWYLTRWNNVFFSRCVSQNHLMSLFDTCYCCIKYVEVSVSIENTSIRHVQNSCVSSHLSSSTIHLLMNNLIPVRKLPPPQKEKCGVRVSWQWKLPQKIFKKVYEITVISLKLVSFGWTSAYLRGPLLIEFLSCLLRSEGKSKVKRKVK